MDRTTTPINPEEQAATLEINYLRAAPGGKVKPPFSEFRLVVTSALAPSCGN